MLPPTRSKNDLLIHTLKKQLEVSDRVAVGDRTGSMQLLGSGATTRILTTRDDVWIFISAYIMGYLEQIRRCVQPPSTEWSHSRQLIIETVNVPEISAT